MPDSCNKIGSSQDNILTDPEQLKNKLCVEAFGVPLGARGPSSGRDYDPNNIGIDIRTEKPLEIDGVRVTNKGIDVVEKHLSRFGEDDPNKVMVRRLRGIAQGFLKPTRQDLNFYTHELREYVRYRKLGWEIGVPRNKDEAYKLWEDTHTATLEDYRIHEKKDSLYHETADNPWYWDHPFEWEK
jgi:hypothetical protein